MALLWLPVGIALPTISGWLLLRLIEGRDPVLFAFERWILGFIGGLTLTMYATFLAHIMGLIKFDFGGFLLVQVVLTGVLSLLYWKKHGSAFSFQLSAFRKQKGSDVCPSASSSGPRGKLMSGSLPRWRIILIAALVLWTALKITTGAITLVSTPPYYDDVFNNWNMRGKLFYETERLTLTIPLGDELFSRDGVSSYPPTVPMVKTWLATLKGEWSEGLINSIHILWYLSALILAFFVLIRIVPVLWALLGTYILSSLPLYLVHGMNSYADVFLSVHILAAVSMLLFAVQLKSSTFLRLSALFTALLIFTKNEALLVYVPPLVLILCIATIQSHPRREHLGAFGPLGPLGALLIPTLLILIPWLMFKATHELPFGNAKAISGLNIGWQDGVLYAVWINTFFEGNWVFLFPLLFGCLVTAWRRAFHSPLLILTAFFLITYLGQLFLYLFTSLSGEALRQTGYARGLIHLAPVACVLATVLLYDIWERCHPTQPSSATNPQSALQS